MLRHFDELPTGVQDRLVALTQAGTRDDEHFVVKPAAASWVDVAIAIAVLPVGLAAVGLMAWGLGVFETPWTAGEAFGGWVTLTVAGLIFLPMIERARAVRRSRLKPAIVVTPLLIARTGTEAEPVEMHALAEVTGVDVDVERAANRRSFTTFSFRTATGAFRFELREVDRPEALQAFLVRARETRREWGAEGPDGAKARDFDWIAAAKAAHAVSRGFRGKNAPGAGGFGRHLVRAAFLAAGVTLALAGVSYVNGERIAWSRATSGDTASGYAHYVAVAPLGLHVAEAEVRRDDRAFAEATRAGSPPALREYLSALPQGRHATEAREALRALCRSAAKRYAEAAAARGGDPAAIAALRAAVEAAGDSDGGISYIFDPGAGEPFSGEDDRDVFLPLQDAFKRAFPDGALGLRKGAAGDPPPRWIFRPARAGEPGSVECEAVVEVAPGRVAAITVRAPAGRGRPLLPISPRVLQAYGLGD